MNNRFSSTSYHGLDAKNRIFIPVSSREALGEIVYVFRQKGEKGNCLRLYTAEHFDKLAQKYNDMEDEALTVEEIEAAAEISRSFFGYVDDVPVVCMKGRVHYYEGYPISDVVLPTRLMKLI